MIQVRDLTKHYGNKRALGPVTLDIAEGEAVGFLGLNGAGKTTALRIMACDLRPSAGSITIDKVDAIANPHDVRRHVGFLPEHAPLYADMTVEDYLVFAGRIQGMSKAAVKKRLPVVIDLTHIGDVSGDLIRNLSHGYQQRVGVAQAVIHDPKLLILDEPTRGLDPVQIVEMRAMIRNLKKKHTILISSHVLPEISETCDRLLVLGAGSVVAAGTEAQLSSQLGQDGRLAVTVVPASGKTDDDSQKQISACVGGVDGVTEVTSIRAVGETFEVLAASKADRRAQVCKALVNAGHGVVRLDVADRKLESLFMQIVQGEKNAGEAGSKRKGAN